MPSKAVLYREFGPTGSLLGLNNEIREFLEAQARQGWIYRPSGSPYRDHDDRWRISFYLENIEDAF
jgi:hypothetical protein